jgi:predicted GNAT superfamily acetyltransferase
MVTSAWETAEAAAAAAGVTLRPAARPGDATAILEIMRVTWGSEGLMPPEMIVALAESGNVPYGAFDGDTMIGYVLGWAGVDPEDGVHVHSHMLAALPDRRHRGVGSAMKLAQRAQCLDQDVHLVRWTFDPMVARNAWLNLGKLGAVADRFRRDLYGPMSDALNAGDRSDRLVVRWDLDRTPGPRTVPASAERLEVPRDHPALRAEDPAAAARERDRVAAALEEHLGAGRIVAGFDAQTSAYLITRVEEVPA